MLIFIKIIKTCKNEMLLYYLLKLNMFIIKSF